jgi:CubicO group peptidase (beta-lactamase class C family)
MSFRSLTFAFAYLILIGACEKKLATNDVDQPGPEIKLQARADSLELETAYLAPPGNPLSHHASGFAKILCSAVFVSGLDFDFAAENIGYFTAPYAERAKLTDRRLDMENKAVHVTLPNGVVRTAKYFGDQGCICLPEGKDKLNFTPVEIIQNLPDPETTPWPMGDFVKPESMPDEVDLEKVSLAVDAAFADPEALTAAFLITYKGEIIGERYRKGITKDTPLESWSMGKSLTATLMGVLIQQGKYELFQPAPIPEWQEPGDPRAQIRIADILRMSSGLRFRAPHDPDFNPELGYPDHLYVYTSSGNTFNWSATRPQQWAPNTVGRYRNCDPSLINYLIRLAVENGDEEYLTFPQRSLFDKIGIRNMVLETDTYGNLLLQGYDFGTARDWARLANLYLNDGIWNGEKLLPEGFVDFVSTVAPAWKADDRPIYGGFFWINGTESFPIPKDAYFMAGAGGQMVFIIPSHDLVVVKLSHYKGGTQGELALSNALEILMGIIPEVGG